MTALSRASEALDASVPPAELARRKPQRISSTVPWHVLQRLEERASYEGRSLSNLIAHLLEAAN